ncbi:MAG: peptide chain release factor N(5)-glutamine methyltransferase [Actinomycetota bacterium]|nr:peptide chain release factor N(5)-glutamine methyltransferase [Actinomycetota bacterium]
MSSGRSDECRVQDRLLRKVGSQQLARWIWNEARSRFSDEDVEVAAFEFADRYLAGEPLQYVFGHWSFRTLELKCDRRGLIPRPETELLVDMVKDDLQANPWMKRVLEIGTGTGAIALALATEVSGLSIVATDVSLDALSLAKENLASQEALTSEVMMVHSDLFSALGGYGLFDLIVSNPPYVPSSTVLDVTVADYEPHQALFGGGDGLQIIAKLISGSPAKLSRRGAELYLEIDESHGGRVNELASQSGFSAIEIHQDLAGKDRFARLIY